MNGGIRAEPRFDNQIVTCKACKAKSFFRVSPVLLEKEGLSTEKRIRRMKNSTVRRKA